MISNELYQCMCSLDANTSEQIADNLRTRANNVVVTGYLLSDAYAIGYSKGIRMAHKLITSNGSSKQNTLKEINNIDLTNYMHNSCKSCWNSGFKQAINHFSVEIEECVGRTLH